MTIDPTSIKSYSINLEHAVMIKIDGSVLGIGNNEDCRISQSLPRKKINCFTEFLIKVEF